MPRHQAAREHAHSGAETLAAHARQLGPAIAELKPEMGGDVGEQHDGQQAERRVARDHAQAVARRRPDREAGNGGCGVPADMAARRMRNQQAPMAARAQPHAQIDIFQIAEEALVEPAFGFEQIAAVEGGGAGGRKDLGESCSVVRRVAHARAPRYAVNRQAVPCPVEPPVRAQQHGRDHGDSGLRLDMRAQHSQAVGRKLGVGVDAHHIVGPSPGQRAVGPARKARILPPALDAEAAVGKRQPVQRAVRAVIVADDALEPAIRLRGQRVEAPLRVVAGVEGDDADPDPGLGGLGRLATPRVRHG